MPRLRFCSICASMGTLLRRLLKELNSTLEMQGWLMIFLPCSQHYKNNGSLGCAMDQNDVRKGSPSRFQWQQVSTQTRNTLFVDKGCQRCQHCQLRPPVSATLRTPIVSEEMNPEEITCKQ